MRTRTGSGGDRDEVATIAAITYALVRRRLGLNGRTDPEHPIDAAGVAAFTRGPCNTCAASWSGQDGCRGIVSFIDA